MGLLYRLDLPTGGLNQLPSQPFYFTTLARGERELYSDPAVSPDSRLVVFAVHAVAGDASDDLVGLSGPLAVMDLASGQRRVLSATQDIGGYGAAFANSPAWSSDGRRLLVAFEVSGAIVDAAGLRLQQMD
jgi:Tol biopolymer transport system component